MSANERELPDSQPPEQATANLVREFRRRIGRRTGAPEAELPALREALEGAGFAVETLEHDADGRRLTIEYAPPEDVEGVGREITLVVAALLATHDSGEWAEGGVEATSPTGTWHVGFQWLRRWEPHQVARRAIATHEELDE